MLKELIRLLNLVPSRGESMALQMTTGKGRETPNTERLWSVDGWNRPQISQPCDMYMRMVTGRKVLPLIESLAVPTLGIEPYPHDEPVVRGDSL